MSKPHHRLAELDELLLRAATERLEPDAAERLEMLRREFPDVDTDVYERTAVAVLLASLRPAGPVPASLGDRIIERSREWLGSDRNDQGRR